MAQEATPTHSSVSIGFKNIELLKEKTLGIGSYGKVCRAKCDNLPCAAKIIHETLYDPSTEQLTPRKLEHRLPMKRFEQECEFLNTIRHPNVIQYLGMYRDPDTGLFVLLMELMDESLTHFLEAATQCQRSTPFHVQVNICHDITLALAFLHANGVIHRDLSSNNVLLIGNVRAKLTDFGMAKLGDLNQQTSQHTFTVCPGTDVYMPPEAVQDQPVYTTKIDCFSFGVIVVQVLSYQFPKPGNRMDTVEMNDPGLTVMVRIPEIDRRQNHIGLIDQGNVLLPIALNCLKDRDVQRPSAQQLCERVAALKEGDAYAESVRVAQTSITQREMQEKFQSMRKDIEHLQESRKKEKQFLIEKHASEIQILQERERQSLKEEHAREIQNLNKIIAAKKQKIQDLHHSRNKAIMDKEREYQKLKIQLREATLQVKRKEKMVEKMEERLKQMRLNLPRVNLQKSDGSDIKLNWRTGQPAPQNMSRWSNAVVDKNTVYFNACGQIVYSYNAKDNLWNCLPDCPNWSSSFVVINDTLAAIGGIKGGEYSNKVYSLKEEDMSWIEEFPPMPTKRTSATSVYTETALIVIGGVVDGSVVRCPVEVMSIETRQWTTVADLPANDKELWHASGIVCGDQLYILGAMNSTSVYSCKLSDLLQPNQSESGSKIIPPPGNHVIWMELTHLPFFNSTCMSLCGRIIAIGGNGSESTNSTSSAVCAYNQTTSTWEVISQISVARRRCFAVALPTTNELMVAGGNSEFSTISSVEFANFIVS